MDIGDLGFLIIAFIVFIVNFIVKSNKEKAEALAQEQKKKNAIPELPEPWEVEETWSRSLDFPYDDERNYDESKNMSKPFIPISDSIKNIENRMQSTLEGMSSLSESLFIDDNMESISYQDEGTEGEASYTNELFHGNVTEELKKGIIYSEILNRKYE